MINIEILNFDYAVLNASDKEFQNLKNLVTYAIEFYDSTDLDYFIPVKAERRLVYLNIF